MGEKDAVQNDHDDDAGREKGIIGKRYTVIIWSVQEMLS